MKKILIVFSLTLLAISCGDILDISPKDRISDDAIWTDENLIKAYHTDLYNSLLHGFCINMQSKMTDEAYCSINWGAGIIAYGTISPDNVGSVSNTDWTGGGNLYIWNSAFQNIRKINKFLEKMEESPFVMDDKDRLIAESKFLRAYIYFMLIERFGEAPIVKQSYELGTDMTFTSASFDECVKFIEENITEAMPSLPAFYATTDANFGRATQAACQALLSRLYLYAASPLFNKNNDKTKWEKASDAAETFLTTYKQYELYPDYTKCFNQPSGMENQEIILARNFTTTNGHQAPMHNLNRRYGAYGGWWASNGPSQNLVDDYDMLNGEPAFVWSNGVKSVNPVSGYDPQNPYKDRDPRLDATVIHDESTYHGDFFEMWEASDGKSWGVDNYRQSGDNPLTNYVLRKFMPGEDTPLSWQTTYTIPWIFFRLGEIYLNYAEAQFELGHEDVCREYISKIRNRVGMPKIPETVTGENLRQRLYNERRVELAFEEHRYFDLRRWKVAMDIENRPIYGMTITKDINTEKKVYKEEKLLERVFTPQMYLLPISTDEIKKNKGTLLQTETWR